MLRLTLVVWFLLGINGIAQGETDKKIMTDVDTLGGKTILDTEPKPKPKVGHSIAPIVGYEPTYRFVVGAAYFIEGEQTCLAVDASLNFKRVYQAHASWTHRLTPDWEYGFTVGGMKGFDPYYGEGGETRVQDRVQLWGLRANSRLHLTYRLTNLFSVGFFGDLRTRTEDPAQGASRTFPNETSAGLGVMTMIDTRKDRAISREGFLFITQVTHYPQGFSTLEGAADFTQAESSFIVFKEILGDALPDVIAAFRLMGGHTFGTPSYLFKYRLGGTDQLPGYLENRFRGKNYYLQQTELRFPIWKMISAAGFLGFGDATDGEFTNAKMAYGIGLRIGLPPSWISKIRIDLAFGRDEQGVFADFGQSF